MSFFGMDALGDALTRAESGGGGGGKFLQNIYWKDDRNGAGKDYQKVLRFLTDDIVVAKFYEFVRGGEKNQPRDFIQLSSLSRTTNGKTEYAYPELEGMVDYFVENNVQLPKFRSEETRPATDAAIERAVGLVVLREEYRAEEDGRTRVKVRDKMYRNDEGNEYHEFGVVKQSVQNFWAPLFSYYGRYGTLTDRDYLVERMGNGKDTKYTVIPLDPDPELDTPEKLAERYNPPMDLKQWVLERVDYKTAQEWLEAAPKGVGATDEAQQQTGANDALNESAAERPQPSAGSLRDELEQYRS